MSAAFERGHFDTRRPSFRVTLRPQAFAGDQVALFTSPAAELRVTACQHPATQWQERIFDGCSDELCVVCGAVVQTIGGLDV